MELHDQQQAQVVERLRAAHGAPVSFDELRAMGVENPALLCYELAAVGLAIERPREPRGGALALSVRLPPQAGARPERANQSEGGGPLPREAPRGLLVAAAVALTLVAAAGIAIALSHHPSRAAASLSADRPRGDARRAPRHATAVGAAAARARGPDRRATHVARALEAEPNQATVSPAGAAALEAEGHQLLAVGRFAVAIGDLRSAIQASGGSLSRCAEPTSEVCLTFAYALYDLGRALQLDGNAAAAIPILSERLRIDNQRATVQQELNLARGAKT